MTARQILLRKGPSVHTVAPTAPLIEAARRLRQHGVGALVVVEREVVVGILSERDLVRAVAERGAAALKSYVSDEMTAAVETCAPDASVRDLMARMTAHRIRHLPILDGGRLVGLVSIGDVVKHRVDEVESDATVLQDALRARWAAALAA